MQQRKLAKILKSEINDFNIFFRELSWLADELKMTDFEDAEINEDYKLLSTFSKNAENFIADIAKQAKSLFWEKLIMNTQTLLENCTDPKAETVEFNEKIQKGFALLKNETDYKTKYEKCISTIKKFDAGIIGMYDL